MRLVADIALPSIPLLWGRYKVSFILDPAGVKKWLLPVCPIWQCFLQRWLSAEAPVSVRTAFDNYFIEKGGNLP